MARKPEVDIPRYADQLAAMGMEPRLRIMCLLLSVPRGMVVGEIHQALGIAGSTLSHHLEKLKNEELVRVQREGTFLRYSANTETLRELLAFLFAECCSGNWEIEPRELAREEHARKRA
jgi:ArsR family transcriptional regulator